REDEARREQLRRDAVARVMADADWMSLLERLIAEVEVPGTLGYVTGSLDDGRIEEILRSRTLGSEQRALNYLAGYAAGRLQAGTWSVEALEAFLRCLLTQDRLPEAVAVLPALRPARGILGSAERRSPPLWAADCE